VHVIDILHSKVFGKQFVNADHEKGGSICCDKGQAAVAATDDEIQ
jgi:hypothetical protein